MSLFLAAAGVGTVVLTVFQSVRVADRYRECCTPRGKRFLIVVPTKCCNGPSFSYLFNNSSLLSHHRRCRLNTTE